MPKMPYVEVGLVDRPRMKHHIYQLPQRRGVDAKFIRSEPLTLERLNKNYTLRPSMYSKLEEYISDVEDWGEDHCK